MLADELDYVLGVDTHRDEHLLAIVTAPAGTVVAGTGAAANARGYRELLRVAAKHAPEDANGRSKVRAATAPVSPASSLAAARRYSKSAARQGRNASCAARMTRSTRPAQPEQRRAAETLALPRTGERREALRLLLVARRSAVDVRGEALIQLRAVIVTAPEPLRQELRAYPYVTWSASLSSSVS
jgi:transposase